MNSFPIKKINHISFNQIHSQFSLSHDNGINVYDTMNLELINSSNTLGDIYMSKLLFEIGLILFFGNENNKKNSPYKIVLYDMKQQNEIYSTIFNSKLIEIQTQQNFILLENTKEINIYKLNNLNNLDFCLHIELPYEINFPFISWNNEENYYILYQKEIKRIEIINLINKNEYLFLNSSKTKNINLPHKKVQKIFYEPISNNIFIVNGLGDKIYEIEINNGKQIREYYRGNSYGYISDILNIQNKYIIICNGNKTIHVYDIKHKSQNKNIFNLISSYTINLNSENLFYSILKIGFNEIFKNNTSNFEKDFELKGALLTYNKEGNFIKAICYNGMVIYINIDYQTPKYFCNRKINFIDESHKSELLNNV